MLGLGAEEHPAGQGSLAVAGFCSRAPHWVEVGRARGANSISESRRSLWEAIPSLLPSGSGTREGRRGVNMGGWGAPSPLLVPSLVLSTPSFGAPGYQRLGITGPPLLQAVSSTLNY